MEVPPGSHSAVSQTQDGTPGSYTLRELIRDIPLSEDDEGFQAHITCVDAWNGNLYIGTSSGQVLHYVSIPPEPSDDSGQASYIFATIIEPPYAQRQYGADAGVTQILVLPNASKACIVCNGTLTFYTLPELSPAFDGRIKQSGCLWVGGLDSNNEAQSGQGEGTVVVICLRQRLRVIRIAEEARKIRDIEQGGISTIQRRGNLACVADGHAYSLIDIVNQRKNELFPISSLSEPLSPSPAALAPPTAPGRPTSRSFSSHSPVRQSSSHARNISLGANTQNEAQSGPDGNSPWPARSASRPTGSPAPSTSREESPAKSDTATDQLPGTTTESATEASSSTDAPSATDPQPKKPEPSRPLPPNIVTTNPNEFLLTTGTRLSEPGVGMFVNLEGDVVRGTIEFSSYPESMVLDGPGLSSLLPMPGEASQEGYVLSIVQRRAQGDTLQKCLEVQRWDVDPGEARRTKEWLALSTLTQNSEDEPRQRAGLRTASTSADLALQDVALSLRLRRLHLTQRTEYGGEAKRNEEENKLAARFAPVQANVLLYVQDRVSWVVRTPLISQLDQQLNDAVRQTGSHELSIAIPVVQRVVNSIRGQDPRDELEFLTLTYTRQKAALLLFGNLVIQTAQGVIAYEHDKRRAEDALVSGDLDPRVVLALVPPLDREISEGTGGIWMAQGLRDTVERLRQSINLETIQPDPKGPYGDNLLQLVKRYLTLWRKKKGFGSIADENAVFHTVDAALLHVLLMLDQDSPRGLGAIGTVRAELCDLVDNGVDCFDRAADLFEEYNRLYMLSRLYQNRRMISQVLATWRRILEGEIDVGGELIEGEQILRKYLTKIRDSALVQEYGSWLARRNPKLAVQVFADDTSRVQFEPSEAVAILRENAPGAVKDYLEYLVFGKDHVQYVNDLIAFYLHTVLHELETSPNARQVLLQSYQTYRALQPPKPTYREFIEDNAIEAEWWVNRLRLLQLIGGSHDAASQYDARALGQRLAPYSHELVPEMIILNGREGNHKEALRLLTHGLGDYDTAVRYCLLGGSSIFHSSSSSSSSGLAREPSLPAKEEQAQLFEHLLREFFQIEDVSERLQRTAELLERFGAWFDLAAVLDLIPDSWSVELVSGFLLHAFRRLVRERNESLVLKALSGAQNLQQSALFIEETERLGPTVVRAAVDVE